MSHPIKAWVAADSAARSVGADSLAVALQTCAAQRDLALTLMRPGSRGLYWLEPMVELESSEGRLAFGPLDAADVSEIIDTDGNPNREHPRYLGLAEEIPQLAVQNRLTFSRVGVIEPLDIDAYQHHDGFEGLRTALASAPEDIITCVTDSGLRGRGGAAFPTGIKWQTVRGAKAEKKYVVCNADEGDSGTFADRMIMESDPFLLIEGMTIAALAVGASHGYVYTRAEYPQSIDTMEAAIAKAVAAGFLGEDICSSGRSFHLEVRKAAGAYICGEETSMLESLEGKRGTVRVRPPLPAVKGLFGLPTVVNNVISLASVPSILHRGADWYRDCGMGKSRGTLTVQLAGNVARGGLYELDFGVSLRQILEEYGGGTASGRPIRAVQAGGPLGAFIPPTQFDTPLDYEAFKDIGALVGHGGLVVFDDTVDMGAMARFAMEFCAIESCGKCTPCRLGAVRGTEVIDRLRAGENRDANRELLRDLCATMVDGSLCALGGMAPFPVLSVLEHFPEDL